MERWFVIGESAGRLSVRYSGFLKHPIRRPPSAEIWAECFLFRGHNELAVWNRYLSMLIKELFGREPDREAKKRLAHRNGYLDGNAVFLGNQRIVLNGLMSNVSDY